MRIARTTVNMLILWLLALTTAVTLATRLPDSTLLTQYLGLFVIYALLTAVSLYFGVILSEGELSSAHVVGMVALLSVGRSLHPVMMWSIALGGLAGGLLLVTRGSKQIAQRPLTERTARSVVVIMARVTLSFFVAGQLYIAVGGRLPLEHLTQTDVLPLTAFSLVYSLVYVAIFLLETYSDGRSVQHLIRTNTPEILTVLALPIPFALLIAEVDPVRTPIAFTILLAGIMLTIFGQYSISRAQYQLRRQVDELQSLSGMSQLVSTNLNLDVLLRMIYVQVAQLLRVDNFVVALHDRSERRLNFPLVIWQGKVQQADVAGDFHNGLIEHILRTQTSLLIPRDVEDHARQMGLTAPTLGLQSWLGVPLLSGGRLLGAMVVASYKSNHRFQADALRLLNIIAASASIAIENARLYEQQTARVTQLVTLNNILSLLNDTLSPETVLDTVISSATALSDANAVAVYLFWDDAASTPVLVRSAGLSDAFSLNPPDPMLMMRHKAHENEQQPIVVTDASDDARTGYLRQRMSQENKCAWVELPLTIGGFGLGAMVLYYDEPRLFTDEQVELYRAFANQVAQAIRNARLYSITDETLERRVGQLLALAAIGHELTATIELETICDLVLSHALDATTAGVGVVILTNGPQGAPQVISERGYPPGAFVNPALLTQGVTGHVLANGQPVRVNDVFARPDYLPLMPTTRSQLSVPIQRGTDTIGMIMLEADRPNSFSDEDTHFVTQLANQAVIAIDNAQLFEHIAEARDRLQVILDAMSEAILLIDNDGMIALANPRVHLLGLTPERLLGRSMDDLLDRPDLDLAERLGFRSDHEVRKLLKEARAAKSWEEREPASYSIMQDGGASFVQRHVIPVYDGGDIVIGVMLVFYDQTEERLLAQAREDLSNMIIHDLRSPLTAVTTSLKLLTDIVPKDSDFRPLVETTTDASRRAIRKLLARVDSLLDVARMGSGELAQDIRPTALMPLAETVRAELSPLARELNILIVLAIPAALQPLAIDADKIERVLLNLLDNALKFSPGDSSVLIRAYLPGTHGAHEKFVRVELVDSGPGVPDDYKTRLFDRFIQVKGRVGSRRGTGLGLTFCRLVIEAHGGSIWIEDNPKGGSIFAFTLPIYDADSQSETAPESASESS